MTERVLVTGAAGQLGRGQVAHAAADHRRGAGHLLGRPRVAELGARAEPVDAHEPARREARLTARGRDHGRDEPQVDHPTDAHDEDGTAVPGASRLLSRRRSAATAHARVAAALAPPVPAGQAGRAVLTFSTNPDIAEQQMNAIIFYLTAFGYIDGKFDFTEKTFVRIYIRQLVHARARALMPDADAKTRDEVVNKFVAHFLEVFEQIDRGVKELFEEAVADGEDVDKFVYAKLKLRSYEIFQTFDLDNQRELLATVDELIYADGSVHPAEAKFRAELEALLSRSADASTPLSSDEIEVVRDQSRIEITEPAPRASRHEDHPFFAGFEQHYSADPARIRTQVSEDQALMRRFLAQLTDRRRAGAGKLVGKNTVADLAGERPFLDGFVFAHPAQPGRSYELTVLGDLHGCYSCLKAALLQADFFAKLEAWRLDARKPELVAVYIVDLSLAPPADEAGSKHRRNTSHEAHASHRGSCRHHRAPHDGRRRPRRRGRRRQEDRRGHQHAERALERPHQRAEGGAGQDHHHQPAHPHQLHLTTCCKMFIKPLK